MQCSDETRAALNDFLLELESMIARALEDGAETRALTYAVVKTLVLRHLAGDDERERDEARAEVEHYKEAERIASEMFTEEHAKVEAVTKLAEASVISKFSSDLANDILDAIRSGGEYCIYGSSMPEPSGIDEVVEFANGFLARHRADTGMCACEACQAVEKILLIADENTDADAPAPQWTSEPPTEPDCYCWRPGCNSPLGDYMIIKITAFGYAQVHGIDMLERPDELGGEWWPVPIAIPGVDR